MKISTLKFILPFFLLFLSITDIYASKNVTPPDSSSNLMDQAQAIIIIDQGKTLFNEGKVRDALIKFRQASVKDPFNWKAPYWVSQCHYVMNNYGLALQYATQAVAMNQNDVDKDVYELLGRTYHRMGILDSALINYNMAISKLPNTKVKELQLELRVEQVMFAQAELSGPNKSKRVAIPSVNTGYDDYTPIFVNGGKGIYFTARRSDTKGGNMNPEDQKFFEDIYYGVWNNAEMLYDSITNELGRINSEGFDAITFISKDGSNGLISINTEASGGRPATKSTDIFTIEKSSKGNWGTPKKIKSKSINTSFFDGSATMTSDGNTMYFVSDRKGDKSSTDIYVVQKVGKTWGEAKPLPFHINTIGKETTPFVTGDGRFLFFSSDGHQGMGGLDIYVVENLGSTWGNPINLGIMVNTVNDDSHFQYFPELAKALMASFEIVGQKSSLDIFEVDMTGFIIPTGK